MKRVAEGRRASGGRQADCAGGRARLGVVAGVGLGPQIQRQGGGVAAARPTEAAGGSHVQHRGADAVADDPDRVVQASQRDDVAEKCSSQSALTVGRGDAEAEVDLAIAHPDMGEGDDVALRGAQPMHVVSCEIEGGDVGGDAFVADAVAEAQQAVIGIQRKKVFEDAGSVSGAEAAHRSQSDARGIGRRCQRCNGAVGGGHGGDPVRAGRISDARA